MNTLSQRRVEPDSVRRGLVSPGETGALAETQAQSRGRQALPPTAALLDPPRDHILVGTRRDQQAGRTAIEALSQAAFSSADQYARLLCQQVSASGG